jgi:hypothetical protein
MWLCGSCGRCVTVLFVVFEIIFKKLIPELAAVRQAVQAIVDHRQLKERHEMRPEGGRGAIEEMVRWAKIGRGT